MVCFKCYTRMCVRCTCVRVYREERKNLEERVVQWSGIHLASGDLNLIPGHGSKIPPAAGHTTKPVRHNCWAHVPVKDLVWHIRNPLLRNQGPTWPNKEIFKKKKKKEKLCRNESSYLHLGFSIFHYWIANIQDGQDLVSSDLCFSLLCLISQPG